MPEQSFKIQSLSMALARSVEAIHAAESVVRIAKLEPLSGLVSLSDRLRKLALQYLAWAASAASLLIISAAIYATSRRWGFYSWSACAPSCSPVL